MRWPGMTLLTFLSAGCTARVVAPDSAVLSVPDDLEVSWDDSWNEQFDALGMVTFADFAVYDERQDYMPLENILIEVTSSYGGVYLVPMDAVVSVDYPSAPEDWQQNFDEYCYDENGNFDPTTNEWCAWYADTVTGEFWMISSEYADVNGYAPNYLQSYTDGWGRLRVFVYIDALPSSGDVMITANIGSDAQGFKITPSTGL